MRRLTLLASLILILALVGCGGDKSEKVDQAEIDRAVQVALEKAERKRSAEATPEAEPTPTATPRRKAASTQPALTACDANIQVRAKTTTCSFAQNVFLAYWLQEDKPGIFADSDGLPAYSPAAEKTFYVQCGGNRSITCRAGDGGLVRFPSTAVSAYSSAQAQTYVRTHNAGDVESYFEGSPGEEPQEDPAPPEGGGYEDIVNCTDTSETDFPTPEGDPNGLDRDGDGISCES